MAQITVTIAPGASVTIDVGPEKVGIYNAQELTPVHWTISTTGPTSPGGNIGDKWTDTSFNTTYEWDGLNWEPVWVITGEGGSGGVPVYIASGPPPSDDSGPDHIALAPASEGGGPAPVGAKYLDADTGRWWRCHEGVGGTWWLPVGQLATFRGHWTGWGPPPTDPLFGLPSRPDGEMLDGGETYVDLEGAVVYRAEWDSDWEMYVWVEQYGLGIGSGGVRGPVWRLVQADALPDGPPTNVNGLAILPEDPSDPLGGLLAQNGDVLVVVDFGSPGWTGWFSFQGAWLPLPPTTAPDDPEP